MTLIAVGSVHGSPGTTTLALDLARLGGRPQGPDVLLVEADPDGGCLAARLDLAVKPGLTELAGAARVSISVDDLWNYAQPTDLGVAVIVAHPAAEQVQAALRAAVNHVGAALREASGLVVVDVGRLRPGSPALALAALAERTLVVSPNSVEAVVTLHHRAPLLRGAGDPLVVLSAARPYSADEVAAACGLDVWGAVGPDTRRGGRRRRARELQRLLVDAIGPADQPAMVGG
jgi:MinD-like ATPase involved in chromosome partitioning or flagellar assembly